MIEHSKPGDVAWTDSNARSLINRVLREAVYVSLAAAPVPAIPPDAAAGMAFDLRFFARGLAVGPIAKKRMREVADFLDARASGAPPTPDAKPLTDFDALALPDDGEPKPSVAEFMRAVRGGAPPTIPDSVRAILSVEVDRLESGARSMRQGWDPDRHPDTIEYTATVWESRAKTIRDFLSGVSAAGGRDAAVNDDDVKDASRPDPPGLPAAKMVLCCPRCGLTHRDEGEWATRPHRTHLCAWCGHEWRPYSFATIGVLFEHEADVSARQPRSVGSSEAATTNRSDLAALLRSLDDEMIREAVCRGTKDWGPRAIPAYGRSVFDALADVLTETTQPPSLAAFFTGEPRARSDGPGEVDVDEALLRKPLQPPESAQKEPHR